MQQCLGALLIPAHQVVHYPVCRKRSALRRRHYRISCKELRSADQGRQRHDRPNCPSCSHLSYVLSSDVLYSQPPRHDTLRFRNGLSNFEQLLRSYSEHPMACEVERELLTLCSGSATGLLWPSTDFGHDRSVHYFSIR